MDNNLWIYFIDQYALSEERLDSLLYVFFKVQISLKNMVQ